MSKDIITSELYTRAGGPSGVPDNDELGLADPTAEQAKAAIEGNSVPGLVVVEDGGRVVAAFSDRESMRRVLNGKFS